MYIIFKISIMKLTLRSYRLDVVLILPDFTHYGPNNYGLSYIYVELICEITSSGL